MKGLNIHKEREQARAYQDLAKVLIDDQRRKKQARGGQAVAKKRPKSVTMPSQIDKHYWRSAPAMLKVDIATGEILIDRRDEVRDIYERGVAPSAM